MATIVQSQSTNHRSKTSSTNSVMQLVHRTIPFILFLLLWLTPPSRLVGQERENSEFKMAVGLYNDAMYDLAVEQFNNFINAYPNTSQGIDARFYLGLTQFKLKKYDDARLTFQNFALAFGEHPKAAEAWMHVGHAFQAVNNEREAASAYERVKVFHPKSPLVPEALLAAGELYRHLGDRESAKRNFRTIIQDYATSSSTLKARLSIGELYAEEGQTDLAEREARRVSESAAPPDVKAGALVSLGKLQAKANLFDAAETTFSSVLKIYKMTPPAGIAAIELGRLEASARKFSSAIEHFTFAQSGETPDSLQAEALFEIGQTYHSRHDELNAQKSFEKLIVRFPKSPRAEEALLMAGRAALSNNKPSEAIGFARRILANDLSQERKRSLILAADASLALNNAREAARFYTQYVDRYPDDPFVADVLRDLARLYQKELNDYRKAASLYEQIVEKYPQSRFVSDALLEIAACLENIGDATGALLMYRRVQESYPSHDRYPEVEERIGYLGTHVVKNRDAGIEKLARLLGEALTAESKPDLTYQLGLIYFTDLKDYPAAAAQFTRAVERNTDPPRIEDALFLKARAFDLFSEIDSSITGQAAAAYDEFLKSFPNSTHADEASYYQYQLSARTHHDRRLPLAQDFLLHYPTSQFKDRVLMDAGLIASDAGDLQQARTMFKSVVDEFPMSPLRTRALVEEGSIFAKLHLADSAIAVWKLVATVSPPDRWTAQAILKLAEMYSTNNIGKAIELWNRLTTEFYYSSLADMARERLPDALIQAGRYDEAISLYTKRLSGIALSPFAGIDEPSLYYTIAAAYDKNGDTLHAEQYYNSYLRRDQQGAFASNAFYALGRLARARGRSAMATSLFRQAAARGGGAATSPDIAELLFQSEQYAEAAKQFSALTASAETLATTAYYRSRAIVSLLRVDKLIEAEKLVGEFRSKVGKKDEYEAEFEYEKGLSLYRNQDHPGAKKVFERVKDSYGSTRFGPWALYYIGKITEVANKLEEAATVYDDILQKHANSDVIPRVLLSLGNMHFNAERFDRAIGYYRQILSNTHGQTSDILPYAMNNLIEAYESTKLYDDALKQARDFVEKFPNDETIIDKKIKVGTLYTKIGYYDQAVLHFQNLIPEAGSLLEAELRYNIGEAYYYKGDYQQAILEFLKVPYLVTRQGKINWTATSFYMAGQAYEKMSKFDEAIGMYQQVIDRPGIDATFKAAARKEIDRVHLTLKKGSK